MSLWEKIRAYGRIFKEKRADGGFDCDSEPVHFVA